MRIGIVVPAEIIDEIITFLSGEFPEIEAVPFPYHSIVEIPDLLSGRQNSETFLFLGDTARRYAEKAVPHVTEWLTIPRSSASLLRLFYRARDKGYPMRIATDLDRRDFFDLAFKEIGMSENDFSLEILPILAYNEGLLIKNAAAMEKLYRMGKVSPSSTRSATSLTPRAFPSTSSSHPSMISGTGCSALSSPTNPCWTAATGLLS